MNVLMNLKIGQRLALGFAIVLGLSILTTVVGIVKMNAIANAAQEMLNEPVRKERLASDWSKNTAVSTTRTAAIIKSSDVALVGFFAKSTGETNRSTAAYLKELQPLLTSETEKAAYARALDVRGTYQSSRDEALKLKAAGRIEESDQVLEKSYLPAADVYQQAIGEFLKVQRTRLDNLKHQIDDARDSARNLVIVLACLGIAFSIACASWMTLSITRPVKQAVDVARRVAEGDLTVDAHAGVRATRDEIGQLQDALQHMSARLLGIVRDIRNGSDAIGTASAQIAAGNQDLSARTEQQAGSLEETAASMEELNSTVTQTAGNARQASVLAATASSVAGRGGAVVAQVVDTMGSIHASSKRIADIIGVIDGIAFQTNILALNAAVEAARAGEQGRGFAVVAGEVRNLAHRSAAAAKEVKALIDDSVEKVDSGTRLVNEAGVTMAEIVGSVQRVTDIIGEIASATDEQRAGIGQVNQAIVQMDQATQQNASLVEEAAAASEAMRGEVQQLARAVSVFRIDGHSGHGGHGGQAPASVQRAPGAALLPRPA